MQYIIIGAGPAGVVAAETLRKHDQDAIITIIGSEPEPPYSRMAIPYLLEGKIKESGSYLRKSASYFDDLNIKVLHDTVEKIDCSTQQISLRSSSGSSWLLSKKHNKLDYDKLLIASGATPVKPPIPGIDHPVVNTCWTLEDARNIAKLAKSGSEVILIGAGFIGCIILESLVKRGVKLTIIETGDRMVPRMMDDKAGGLLKNWCEDKGVKVMTSCTVESINNAGNRSASVSLGNGSTLPADLIVTATGVRSNVSFLKGSGIKVDQGIVVDQMQQTSDPNIYAAGDVAQGYSFSSGEYEVHAIQPTATDHGRIAALNMAGKNTSYTGSLNMNVLDTLGLISCSFGLWMGVEDGDSVELYNANDFLYINLQFDKDVLVGASATGTTQHIGVLRGLIESRTSLGVWKDRLKKDPTCVMEAYMACTREIGYGA